MTDQDADLYVMVGEIRSDVKKLLKSETDNDARITKLEHRQWWLSGVGAALAFLGAHLGLGHYFT